MDVSSETDLAKSSQVFTPYSEVLTRVKDADTVTAAELEEDRTAQDFDSLVLDVAERARNAICLARERGVRIATLDVKVCTAALVEDWEISVPGAPEDVAGQQAKNVCDRVVMCEVYNSLARDTDLCYPGAEDVYLLLFGYEGYRSTDARHVQDSDDVMWLADLSAEQVPFVLWVSDSHKNGVLNYQIPRPEFSDADEVFAYARSSHALFVGILAELTSNAAAAFRDLGASYPTLYILAKLRWLVHRAKGKLVRSMPLISALGMAPRIGDVPWANEITISIERNRLTWLELCTEVATAGETDLVTVFQAVYARTGSAEDTEQEILWQMLTYRLFKVLQAKDTVVRHVNIYDRHDLETGHEDIDGTDVSFDDENAVDELFMKALGVTPDNVAVLDAMTLIESATVPNEHYGASMEGCRFIKNDKGRLRARETWVLPEAIEKEIRVIELSTKVSKTLIFVNSTTIVECRSSVAHKVQRGIRKWRGITTPYGGLAFDLNEDECNVRTANVVTRIVQGKLGYEAFRFLANLVLRGCVNVSTSSTTASFVPKRNLKDDGIPITSFISRSVMSSATYGFVDDNLCWLPGEGLNPMRVREDRRNRAMWFEEYDFRGRLKGDVGGLDVVFKVS